MAWYKLASHLHLPLQEVKQKTTSSEFANWMMYLEREWSVLTKQDYYLAQIAAYLVKVNSSKKASRKIRISDFLLKFDFIRKKKKMSIKEKTEAAKRFWFGLVGKGNK